MLQDGLKRWLRDVPEARNVCRNDRPSHFNRKERNARHFALCGDHNRRSLAINISALCGDQPVSILERTNLELLRQTP